jgi:hypothetical protein
MGQAKLFGKWAGNQCGLVVAALAFPITVERYWDYDVRGQRIFFIRDEFGKAFGKPRAQRLDLLEFQKQNGLHQRSFIDCEASGSVKGVCFVAASRTQQGLPLQSRQSWQGQPADFARKLRDALKSAETLRTNGDAACIDEEFIADAATRRKDHADQRVAGFGKPSAHTPLPKPRVSIE